MGLLFLYVLIAIQMMGEEREPNTIQFPRSLRKFPQNLYFRVWTLKPFFFVHKIIKQEQIVLERSARLNLDHGRGDWGDGGDG